jgi:hypothetical protein
LQLQNLPDPVPQAGDAFVRVHTSSDIMSQAAPTFCMNAPMPERTLAMSRFRKVGNCSGRQRLVGAVLPGLNPLVSLGDCMMRLLPCHAHRLTSHGGGILPTEIMTNVMGNNALATVFSGRGYQDASTKNDREVNAAKPAGVDGARGTELFDRTVRRTSVHHLLGQSRRHEFTLGVNVPNGLASRFSVASLRPSFMTSVSTYAVPRAPSLFVDYEQ